MDHLLWVGFARIALDNDAGWFTICQRNSPVMLPVPYISFIPKCYTKKKDFNSYHTDRVIGDSYHGVR